MPLYDLRKTSIEIKINCQKMQCNVKMLFVTLSLRVAEAFWDLATTTPAPNREDTISRMSFFRWQRAEPTRVKSWYPQFDWTDQANRRRLNVIAGISIDFLPLSTACIMNKRVLISSANYLDPYMHRQRDLRIWALGRAGKHTTPYRYRVWRVWRVLPKSASPEHQHGPHGDHVPRHDVTVLVSLDQIYVYYTPPTSYMYAYRALLTGKHSNLTNDLLFAGSGYEYLLHIKENYKIFYTTAKRSEIVDCSKYLPKWWGKFICIRNVNHLAGVQNGGALLSGEYLVGVGCFEIRVNEDRVFAFTDLRYYVGWIYKVGNIQPGQYYEYAYPQWGVRLGTISDSNVNRPYLPHWQKAKALFPLG
ncbi:unnamed protein product [Colias eurytheme]|nr:unnamed protein product [Colias eurytheme]